MATLTAQHLTILENNVLESSMGSTQGLLSFMTNASRQIKTYLGPEANPKYQRRQQKQQQILLQQLSQLKSSNFNFIPDILTPHHLTTDTAPSSPTPSLDSVGSANDDYDESPVRSSCSLNRRKRQRVSQSDSNAKRSRYNSNQTCLDESALDYDLNNIIPTLNFSTYNHNQNTPVSHTPSTYNNYNNSNFSFDKTFPTPSPDFDDLMNCMLTEDSLSKIDVDSYFRPL